MSQAIEKKQKQKKHTRSQRGLLHMKVNKLFFGVLVILGFGVVGLLYAWNYSEIHSLYPVYGIRENGNMSEIEPREKLQFRFSQPVKNEDIKNGFTITPTAEGDIQFHNSFLGGHSYGFSFAPQNGFDPNKRYVVSIDSLESVFGTRYINYSEQFFTITSPEVTVFNPGGSVENVAIDSEIELKHSHESRYFEHSYELLPQTDVEVIEEKGGAVTLVPASKLNQGTEYTVAVTQEFINSDNLGRQSVVEYNSKEFKFKTADAVEIVSVYPDNGEDRASLNSEVSIQFNKKVDYQSAESSFSIEPPVEGVFGWEDRTLIFNPSVELENPKEYTVTIASGVEAYDDDGFLENDYQFTFTARRHEKEIIPPEEVVPVITEGKYIDVDLGDQYLTLFEDGRSKGSFQISSGRYDLPTPVGTFHVINKVPLAYSATYDLYMPFWMAFTYAGHGFHELPFWKFRGGAEYKERESHLGTRVSHGCVRLGVGPAEVAYKFADVGTPIVIHN